MRLRFENELRGTRHFLFARHSPFVIARGTMPLKIDLLFKAWPRLSDLQHAMNCSRSFRTRSSGQESIQVRAVPVDMLDQGNQ
jgi:hypothetical protein